MATDLLGQCVLGAGEALLTGLAVRGQRMHSQRHKTRTSAGACMQMVIHLISASSRAFHQMGVCRQKA